MKITAEEISKLHRIERVQLEAWVEHRWIRPTVTAEGPVFDDLDEARIALIRELREDLGVGDEAIEVVLSLLDQLYATRRLLRSLSAAMSSLPEPLRDEIRRRLESGAD
jgi:chaperone modulatory protein CbpM